METKKSRIEIPETIYLHLKQKMKDAGNYRTVGEYVLHQLDELVITLCENDKLAKENKELKESNEQHLKERRQASIQISASESRANSLQKELKAKENLESELRELKDKYTTLQTASEAKDIDLRKLKSERDQTENRLRVVEAENKLNKSLLDYKQTFVGKIKNLFA